MTRPSCFIVYAHVDDHPGRDQALRQKIDTIIGYLRSKGVTVFSDRESGNAGQSIADFNQRLRLDHADAVDFVIVIGTPELKQKYQRGIQVEHQLPEARGSIPVVYHELKMVYERTVLEDQLVKRKELDVSRSVIPFLLEGTKEIWPPFIKNKELVYVKGSDPSKTLEEHLEKVLQTIQSHKKTSLSKFQEVKDAIREVAPLVSKKTLLEVHWESIELDGEAAALRIDNTLSISVKHTADRMTLTDHASDLHVIASQSEQDASQAGPSATPSVYVERGQIEAKGKSAILRVDSTPPGHITHKAQSVTLSGNASGLDLTSGAYQARLRRQSHDEEQGMGGK